MRERLSVTVPEEIIKKAREMAEKEDRTLSAMVAVLLKDAINRKEKAA